MSILTVPLVRPLGPPLGPLGVASASGSLITAPQQIQDALAIAAALESQSKALSNLSMHSQRLSRQFERTAAQLRDVQKTRGDREEQELENLLDVIEMYQCKGEKFDHSAYGFVFSNPHLYQGIHARNRESLPLPQPIRRLMFCMLRSQAA
jgi:hypothetical protein